MKQLMNSVREKTRAVGANLQLRKALLVAGITGSALVLPDIAAAATTGTEFQDLYNFVNNAATGYLGRALAITGGLFGLGVGAATGRAMLAALGIVLAIFGALGPTIVDAIFGAGAII